MTSQEPRCGWALSSADYLEYHDTEWGNPVRDDVSLFERLALESFQSGLSWITVLRKRAAFRECFAGFDPVHVAEFSSSKVSELLQDARIIRHRGKIEATITNARAVLALWERSGVGTLTDVLTEVAPTDASLTAQGFTRPPAHIREIPSQCAETAALAKRLKQAGFVFLGPTTLYSALQATGFVNDHILGCPQR